MVLDDGGPLLITFSCVAWGFVQLVRGGVRLRNSFTSSVGRSLFLCFVFVFWARCLSESITPVSSTRILSLT